MTTEPPTSVDDMASLRARTELACIHVLDHALAQRGDGVRTHGQLLSWMRLKHLDPQDRPHGPLSTISHLVTATAAGPPRQRAIAQRFRGVLDMFSSLEVKVLYPT